MKKVLLKCGICLLVLAVICFGIAVFYHWAVFSVMDGTKNLYDRLFRMRRIFLYAGIALSIAGAAALVIRFTMKTD